MDRTAIATLDLIDAALRRRLDDPAPGLLDGACGAALFYAYYYERTGNDDHAELVHRIVGRLVEALARDQLGVSHCSGIAGIAWCLDHLIARGHVEIGASADAFFEPVDTVLCDAVLAAARLGQRDFLHHGLGALVYLVGRLPAPRVASCLGGVIDELARTSTTDAEGTRWMDHMPAGELEPPGPRFNLGLAHGIPGILSLVSLVYAAGIATDRAGAMLRDGARWLRAQRRVSDGSLYPFVVDRAGDPVGLSESRLGWCYGDLGVATALTSIGTRLGDATLVEEAYDILRHTIRNRTPEDGRVEDAALCHGSMGIAHIYRRAHRATGDAGFGRAAEAWARHGLALGTWTDGVAGFKHRIATGFVSCTNLLQGASGIGLVLLGLLDPGDDPAWDRCMLLS